MRHTPTHENIHDKKTARHRRATPAAREMLQQTWARISKIKSVGSSQVALGVSVLTCLAFAAMASSAPAIAVDDQQSVVAQPSAARAAGDRASRSIPRSTDSAQSTVASSAAVDAGPADATVATAAPASAPAAVPTAAAEATVAPVPAAAPTAPIPVTGLSQIQMNNAQRIVAAGKALGLPKRAFVLAVACALQESNLLNLASAVLPESYSYPNEGSGSDSRLGGAVPATAEFGMGAASRT